MVPLFQKFMLPPSSVFWVVTLCSVVAGYRRESLKSRLSKLILLQCPNTLYFLLHLT